MIVETVRKYKKIIYRLIFALMVATLLINFVYLHRIQDNNREIISEIDAIKINNLELQLNDLKQIRNSINAELEQLERRRNKLLEDVNDLEQKVDVYSSKLSSVKKKSNLAETKYYNELIKVFEIVKKFENSMNSIQFADEIVNKKDKIISYNNEIISSNKNFHSLGSCFNYEKCDLYSKFKIYFFYSNEDNFFNNNSSFFQIVDSIENSCLAVMILKNSNDIMKLKKLFDTLQSNNNILIINLIENFNLFDENFSEFQESQMNYLKCSFYASYSYFGNNQIYASRFDNLFFHFSIVDLNLNEHLAKIYNDQNQTRLLLTHQRKYLISHYEESFENHRERPVYNRIYLNCDAFTLSSCDDTLENRLENLSNSTFLLLPIKTNSSSTFWSVSLTKRLIESLSVGTIPVLLNLNSKLPLSEHINWDEIVIRFSIEYSSQIEKLLLNFNQIDLIDRRVKAYKVYNAYFKTPEKQFQTLLTSVRERIRLPSMPIDSSFEIVEVVPPIVPEIELNMQDYYDSSLNNDEYLGPVARNTTINLAYESKSFQFNFTFNSYFSWNKLYYPFASFPSTPFDGILPTNLKYSFIDSSKNPDPLYFHGGTHGGQYFNFKLAGNNEDYEQFTIIILTYKREKLLISILVEYLNLPYLNQIILIWNSVETRPSEKFYFIFKDHLESKFIRLVFTKVNSLNNRFLPYDFIKTDAVLSLDDDTQLRNDEIIFAFRVWRENRDRIVGFAARFHTWNVSTQSFSYRSQYTCEYSMILTGAAMYHRFYHHYYTYLIDERIRKIVDELMNCEDVAFNFMVSDLTRKPPIKVTTRWRFYCKLCNQTDEVHKAFSSSPEHYRMRGECINYFNSVYGYNPLLYTQARMDSVLFKTKIPEDVEKCYKNV